jgi:RNA polymerase subunit RPABC4/transcription elongation factor Spt4
VTDLPWVEDSIQCPYCKSEDTDERITSLALCNQCNRIFPFEECSLFRSRKISRKELGMIRSHIQELRSLGFTIKNSPEGKTNETP